MRSTRDIVNAVKDGQPVSEDELRVALLVMSAVDAFTWRELYDLIEALEQDEPAKAAAKAAFSKNILERVFKAKREDPAGWPGAVQTAGAYEQDRWLKISKTLLESIQRGIDEPSSSNKKKPQASPQPNAPLAPPPAENLEATEKAKHAQLSRKGGKRTGNHRGGRG